MGLSSTHELAPRGTWHFSAIIQLYRYLCVCGGEGGGLTQGEDLKLHAYVMLLCAWDLHTGT